MVEFTTDYGEMKCKDCKLSVPRTSRNQFRCKPCAVAFKLKTSLEFSRAKRQKLKDKKNVTN